MPSKRRRAARQRAPSGAARETSPQPTHRWQWRTFPVFCAFVAGLLIASIVNGRPNNGAAAALQILSLFGVGLVLAHLFVRNVIVAGRLRRQAKRGPAEARQWVDEVVHPEDNPDERA